MTDPTGRRKRPPISHNNKKNEMKFCKDCKHADERPLITRCTHDESRISPVSGERGAAFIARLEGGFCGANGSKFEPKPEPPVVIPPKPWWIPAFLWRVK